MEKGWTHALFAFDVPELRFLWSSKWAKRRKGNLLTLVSHQLKPKKIDSAVFPKTKVKLYPVHALSLRQTSCFLPFSYHQSLCSRWNTSLVLKISQYSCNAFTFVARSSQRFPPHWTLIQVCQRLHVISLAKDFENKFNANTLLGHIKIIQGIWSNACTLGVFDEGLWAVEVILNALAIPLSLRVSLCFHALCVYFEQVCN